MMVVPAALISRRSRHMPRRISMSTPAVGSSRISSRGRVIIPRAIISLRFMPPESVRDIFSALSHRRSEEHTFELQAPMPNSYAVFCLHNTQFVHFDLYRYHSVIILVL